MLVNLFSDSGIESKSRTRCKQVESRSFILDKHLKELEKHAIIYNRAAFDSYVDELKELLSQGRNYKLIGNAGSDNLYELELLGLGKYTKRFVVEFDYSNALSLVLAVLTGSCQEYVKKLDDYELISKALIRNDTSLTSNTDFKSLFSVDRNISIYFSKLIQKYELEGDDYDIKTVLANFYEDLLNTLEDIKGYVMLAVNQYTEKNLHSTLVYRSKTFYSSLGTLDDKLDEPIIIRYNNEDFELKVNNYEIFEYVHTKIFY